MCAKIVEYLMKDQRSKDAIKAALDFADGKISKRELDDAAADAAAAAVAAAYAADAAAAAYKKNQKQTANICRKVLTDAVFAKVKELIR